MAPPDAERTSRGPYHVVDADGTRTARAAAGAAGRSWKAQEAHELNKWLGQELSAFRRDVVQQANAALQLSSPVTKALQQDNTTPRTLH
jgi:hypothetical protein